jgi:hypothetical protein
MNHTRQSDDMGIIIDRLDRSADIRKITLFEFPFDAQLKKPLARNALIREINNGVSFVNYFGHGSYTTIADQETFKISDISSLTNVGRYFIFGAFSCSVGFFDHPAIDGLSELLVRAHRFGNPTGAIAAISATRTAFATENEAVARSFFESFYSSDEDNRPVSVGSAFLQSKDSRYIPTFALFGDPSYIPMPNRRTINNIKISDSKGEEVDTLQKMQNVFVSATLPIPNDNVSRTVEIFLQNPENLSPTRKDGLIHPANYRLPGMIAARQTAEFTGNSFRLAFMIPPSVIDTVEGSMLKVHVSSNERGDNMVFTGVKDEGIIFSGWDVSSIDTTDSEGPTIIVEQLFSDSTGMPAANAANTIVGNRIIINGFGRGSSGTVSLNIRVTDKSGVDIFSSQTPGSGVSVSIDRVRNRKQYDRDDLTLVNDDFRNVLLTLQLSENEFPAIGEYEMTITARDVLQNSSSKRYILDIRSLKDEVYEIGDFFCYPSPVHMGQKTQFFFNQPVDNVAQITLNIYTLNGKLVRSFPNAQRGVVWDLTDQRGRKMSTNVYLYRLFVRRYARDDGMQSSGRKTETIKSRVRKMVIYPPK